MKKYWITLATGEFGYLWAEQQPMFAEFVTITCVSHVDGSISKAYGQVYKVE